MVRRAARRGIGSVSVCRRKRRGGGGTVRCRRISRALLCLPPPVLARLHGGTVARKGLCACRRRGFFTCRPVCAQACADGGRPCFFKVKEAGCFAVCPFFFLWSAFCGGLAARVRSAFGGIACCQFIKFRIILSNLLKIFLSELKINRHIFMSDHLF